LHGLVLEASEVVAMLGAQDDQLLPAAGAAGPTRNFNRLLWHAWPPVPLRERAALRVPPPGRQ
jgi:hypothetical protein